MPGGFLGRLTLADGTLGGTLDFAPAGQDQRIDAHLTADQRDFPGAFAVRTGRADGTIILADDQTTIEGSVDARGLSSGGVALARLTANAHARQRHRPGPRRLRRPARRSFAFSTLADVTPDRIRLTGNGQIENQPLVLNQPAVLTRAGDGWALAPTSFSFAGGNANVSGRSGSAPEVHAQLGAMPLQVLDLLWPSLDLSGSATGRVDYAWKSNRSGQLRAQGPRAQPRRPRARVQADRRRALRRWSTATARRCARSRRATERSSAARRRGSRRSAADRSWPSC